MRSTCTTTTTTTTTSKTLKWLIVVCVCCVYKERNLDLEVWKQKNYLTAMGKVVVLGFYYY